MDIYGILGYPVSHSFSPQIHNPAFKELGIKALYQLFKVHPDSFESEIAILKNSSKKGFNVTVPFKKKIIPFIDSVDTLAKKVNAVNTVKNENGKWYGFNTDLYGFIKPIQHRLHTLRNVLVIGAGGSANAICFALIEQAYIESLTILNRTIENAEALKNILSDHYDQRITTGYLDKRLNDKFDLIINTTPAGMSNFKNILPFNFSENIHKESVIYDLIYNPQKTLFLKLAEECHLFYLNGLDMLIAQAQKSFEIWTGMKFPDKVIDKRIFYKNS